jgi:two-component system, LuxR family, response regulator FixJ
MNPVSLVYLVDDDPSVSKALTRLFHAAGFRFAAFSTAQDFLDQCDIELPSCLVLDVQLPGQSGLDLQREISNRSLSVPIVFITGHGDVPMAVEAMRAGAIHFLQKPFENRDLLSAVRQSIDKQLGFCAALEEKRQIESQLASLSAREREVFALVALGLANKSIAAKLDLSLQAIKLYRARVMQKLGLDSVADLVRLAQKAEPVLSHS